MQGAGTWPVSMSQEQPHQCQAAAIAACRLRRQRLPLEPTSVGCLVAESLMARAAGRMRQASPDQNAHNSTDFRPADFASSIILGRLLLRPEFTGAYPGRNGT